MNKIYKTISVLFLCLVVFLTGCGVSNEEIDLTKISYSQESYTEINENIPSFSKDEITNNSFEEYSELDELGRCGVAVACVGQDIMPTEERGAIGQVKPSGWQLVKYDIVDGKYLYNRCHLIGYQLTGENANEKNLITGTRSMNVDGMLPYENMVADYVKETGNHVMYRVTPVYDGNNLVAKGVQMEALSVEDNGKGVSFNVFVFNAQPGIEINYADGTSRLLDENIQNKANEVNSEVNEETKNSPEVENQKESAPADDESDYVLNTNTKKIHYPDCPSVADTKEKNKENYNGTREYLIENGYTPCNRCMP